MAEREKATPENTRYTIEGIHVITGLTGNQIIHTGLYKESLTDSP